MSASTIVQASEVSEKIRNVLERLEKELRLLKENELKEIEILKSKSEEGIQHLKYNFDMQLTAINDDYRNTITLLEEEIEYLKELSDSQRLMMKANLSYIKKLELRLQIK